MTTQPLSRPFIAPGTGTWKQDGAHSPRPLTRWKFETFDGTFVRGFKEGTARYGLLFDHLEPAVVNEFLYYRDRVVDPSDGAEVGRRFEAAKNAFEKKLWLEDLDRWDREVKPDSIRRNRALESTPMRSLDTEAFIRHLDAVRENAGEMVYRHHIFTVGSVLPVGHYLASAAEWTGLDSGTLLAPLKGSSRVSLGASDELAEVGARLREAAVDASNFQGMSAADTLAALKARCDALGAAVRAYFDAVGMRLAGGYDVCEPCAIELSDMMLGTIWASREVATRSDRDDAATVVRDAVPAAHRAEFDELLDNARRINRLRDERGIFNDTWGSGIARQALLEAGRRLVEAGRLDDANLAIDATHAELIAALRGTTPAPAATWRERADWRRNAPLSEVPPFLGPPPTAPPPLDGLPLHARLAMRAFGTVLGELFGAGKESQGRTITGKPVSPGVYTGRARLIIQTSDMDRLVQGDVLITSCTSPALNIVLPLLGAIVTDRGGQLSHAAIVAREYGIPAVVGTHRATTTIPDGAQVEVDGTQGTVRLL
jgi:rifampicin phosphotransferase